jgi:site-specific DNA-methyltransferase (adenine-specific)
LKPAYEPIVVARKPLVGTIAENVLRYGVGGLNIDGCRVATVDTVKIHSRSSEAADSSAIFIDKRPLETHQTEGQKLGRWPANLIHDGSEEVVRLFPDVKTGNIKPYEAKTQAEFRQLHVKQITGSHTGDSGSAARFFYCSKADNRDRNDGCENLPPRRHSDRPSDDLPGGDNPRNRTNNERSNFHPCVKPTDLMRYLCRLVTPPGGLVLDPFMGSGSTGKAAVLEGFNFVGCELDPDYLEIARARIAFAGGEEPEKPVVAAEPERQLSLMDLWGRK